MSLVSSWITKSCLPQFSDHHIPLVSSGIYFCPSPLFFPPNQSVAAIVYANESSHSRLYPLTKRRSEAAIPLAGTYRLIDAVVTNCINSNITKIYALTQFNSTSLNSHLTRAYSGASLPNNYGLVEVIAAHQTTQDNPNTGWFQGSADAIRRCLSVLEEHPTNEFLILPGHHLYKMDYQKLIDAHRRRSADITISAFSGTGDKGSGFGILKLNNENRVVEFQLENTLVGEDATSMRCSFPSMGIYVVNRDILIKLLQHHFPTANSLSEGIGGAVSLGMEVHAYKFDGYWGNMMNIAAYYNANMETLERSSMAFIFNDNTSPFYTLPRRLPPTQVTDAAIIKDSIIADGCFLGRCRIKGSVVGTMSRVGNDVVIEDSVIMGSHTNHNNGASGSGIPIGIGEGAHVRKAIVDKSTRIGRRVKIINRDNVEEGNMEEKGYMISGGIVVVIRNAVIPDGTII